MSDQHARNIQKWLNHIEANNLDRRKMWVPIDKFNLKFGFEVPPAVFWSFKRAALNMGSYFGITFAFLISILEFRDENLTLLNILISSVLGGLGFGVFAGVMQTISRRKLKLGTWEDFIKSVDSDVNHT